MLDGAGGDVEVGGGPHGLAVAQEDHLRRLVTDAGALGGGASDVAVVGDVDPGDLAAEAGELVVRQRADRAVGIVLRDASFTRQAC